ncbi:hypothetical protein EON77_16700, partial [bacterium]
MKPPFVPFVERAPSLFGKTVGRIKRFGRDLSEDESGAIAVFGLMASGLLVGLIWFILGVGNSVAIRERAQEAADAVAFSSKVAHARGMHALVLLNLVASAILAIRLFINMFWFVFLGITILAAILAAIPFTAPVWIPIAVNSARILAQLSRLKRIQKQPVSLAMEALAFLGEQIIVYGGATQNYVPRFVARAYAPVIIKPTRLVSEPQDFRGQMQSEAFISPADGLPAEDDTDGAKLCGKAGSAILDIATSIFPPTIVIFKMFPVLKSIMRKAMEKAFAI